MNTRLSTRFTMSSGLKLSRRRRLIITYGLMVLHRVDRKLLIVVRPLVRRYIILPRAHGKNLLNVASLLGKNGRRRWGRHRPLALLRRALRLILIRLAKTIISVRVVLFRLLFLLRLTVRRWLLRPLIIHLTLTLLCTLRRWLLLGRLLIYVWFLLYKLLLHRHVLLVRVTCTNLPPRNL